MSVKNRFPFPDDGTGLTVAFDDHRIERGAQGVLFEKFLFIGQRGPGIGPLSLGDIDLAQGDRMIRGRDIFIALRFVGLLLGDDIGSHQ
ncbi:hypothetical protein QW131_32885 [Roseibium salinum]|nr:hypothetical protein [Roseibium salinum]